MALIGTLVTAFRADTRNLEAGTKRAKSALADFARSGSDLNSITTLIRGGGALAILESISRGIKSINDALREMEQTGGFSFREFSRRAVENTYIIGNLSAGISELRGRWIEFAGLPDIFGDKALLDATRGEEAMLKINEALKQQRKEWEATEKATRKMLDLINELARRQEVAFMSPAGKAGMGIFGSLEDTLRQIEESGAKPDVKARAAAQARATAMAEYTALQESLRRDQEQAASQEFMSRQEKAAAELARFRAENERRIKELDREIEDRRRDANEYARESALDTDQFKRDLMGLDTESKGPGSFRQLNMRNVDIRGLQAGDPLVKLNEQANKYLKEIVDEVENMGMVIQA